MSTGIERVGRPEHRYGGLRPPAKAGRFVTLLGFAMVSSVLFLVPELFSAKRARAEIVIEAEKEPYSPALDKAEKNDLAATVTQLAQLDELHAQKEADLVRHPSSGISENLRRTDELRTIEGRMQQLRDKIVTLEGRIRRRDEARRKEEEARQRSTRSTQPLPRPPSTAIAVPNIEGGMSDKEFQDFLKNKREMDSKLERAAGLQTHAGDEPSAEGTGARSSPVPFGRDEALLAGYLTLVALGAIAFVRRRRGRPGARSAAAVSKRTLTPPSTELIASGESGAARHRPARHGLGILECPVHHISYTEATGCPCCNRSE